MGTGPVSAEPAAITKAKSEAEALQERVDELNDQLEAAVEDYNYAKAQLGETKTSAKQTQTKLTKTEKDLFEVRARLNDRIVQIYKQGQLGALGTIVDARSLSDLVTRLDLLRRLSSQDGKLLADVKEYRDQVEQRKAELAQQLEDEKQLTAETDAAKQAVQERLAANEKALAGKETQIAQLEKEEAIRQAKLAAAAKEAARKAAEAAKAKALAAAKANASTSGGSSKVKVSVPSSASTSDVVSVAMKYLGSTYVWAGASPNGFDCSGFTMYVYAKVGVSLPHSSRMQISSGQSVSSGNLRPGDLVFFGNPTIHHVGLYIGDGKMIHAAGVGKGVRIDSVWRSNYHGACRIIL